MKFDLFFLSFLYKGTSGATYEATPLSPYNPQTPCTLAVALRAIFVLFWRIK